MLETWTDERIAELKRTWDLGWTCSQVACHLGNGISRNAVIGKVHRLDLAGRAKPAPSDGLNKDQRRKQRYWLDQKFRQAILEKNKASRRKRGDRPTLVTEVSAYSGVIKRSTKLVGRAPEMTKTQMREFLAQAVRNTAAMEVA